MANTTVIKGRSLQIKGLDADWAMGVDLANFTAGLRIRSITCLPGTSGDKFVIKDSKDGVADTLTAPDLFNSTIVGTEPRTKYFNEPNGFQCWPFIDISDCSLTGGTLTTCRVEIVLA